MASAALEPRRLGRCGRLDLPAVVVTRALDSPDRTKGRTTALLTSRQHAATTTLRRCENNHLGPLAPF
eukprot:364265-Chlamydomonas_euryale.AAC.9